MKKYLLRSFIFFGIALLVSIGVFIYLTTVVVTSPGSKTETPINTLPASEVVGSSTPRETPLPSIIPPTGFPLRMLPLSETQKSVLSASGIDIETFMITPEMIVCGEKKIGKERMSAISEGSSPSIIEMSKILPCLSA